MILNEYPVKFCESNEIKTLPKNPDEKQSIIESVSLYLSQK